MSNEEPLSGTLNLTIQDLNHKIDAIYRHGVLQEEYSRQVHDYGEGNLMTETEAHTLGYICDNHEVTVTHLAETFFRTKGTISKLLARLEEKGLIARIQRDGNKKWVYFKPTEKGPRKNTGNAGGSPQRQYYRRNRKLLQNYRTADPILREAAAE